jgi:hypothetical protein
MQKSPSFSLTLADFKKIGIGALVAIAGAVLTYGAMIVSGTDFTIHIPAFNVLGITIKEAALNLTPFVVAFWSVVANIVRKWISEHTISE